MTHPVSLRLRGFFRIYEEQTINIAALELLLCEEHKQANAISPDVIGENCT